MLKVTDVLFQTGLARSKGEAARMVKQGQIRIGGCSPAACCDRPDYACCHKRGTPTFTHEYRGACPGWSGCHCTGWERVLDPQNDVSEARGAAIRVGTGDWQCKPKLDDGARFNQFPGIARIPYEADALEGFCDYCGVPDCICLL